MRWNDVHTIYFTEYSLCFCIASTTNSFSKANQSKASQKVPVEMYAKI